MKFQIQKAVFLDALSAAVNAVPNKSTIQILNNFALRLEGNVL
jgi:DNA polymerase-3 subunit beta